MFVSANYTFAALCNRNTSSSGLMNHMVFMKHVVFLTHSIPGAQLLGIHRGCEMYLVLNGQYQSFKHKPANQLRTSLFFFMCAKSKKLFASKGISESHPPPSKASIQGKLSVVKTTQQVSTEPLTCLYLCLFQPRYSLLVQNTVKSKSKNDFLVIFL